MKPNGIDKLFKSHFSKKESSIQFDANDWADMEALLDKKESKKRVLIFWRVAAVILLFLLPSGLFLWNKINTQNPLHHQNKNTIAQHSDTNNASDNKDINSPNKQDIQKQKTAKNNTPQNNHQTNPSISTSGQLNKGQSTEQYNEAKTLANSENQLLTNPNNHKETGLNSQHKPKIAITAQLNKGQNSGSNALEKEKNKSSIVDIETDLKTTKNNSANNTSIRESTTQLVTHKKEASNDPSDTLQSELATSNTNNKHTQKASTNSIDSNGNLQLNDSNFYVQTQVNLLKNPLHIPDVFAVDISSIIEIKEPTNNNLYKGFLFLPYLGIQTVQTHWRQSLNSIEDKKQNEEYALKNIDTGLKGRYYNKQKPLYYGIGIGLNTIGENAKYSPFSKTEISSWEDINYKYIDNGKMQYTDSIIKNGEIVYTEYKWVSKMDTSKEIISNYDTTITQQDAIKRGNKIKLFELPVELGYVYQKERWNLSFGFGPTINIPLKTELIYPDIENVEYVKIDKSDLRKVIFGSHFSIGYGRKIAKHWSINTSLNYRLMLQSVYKDLPFTNLYKSYGLQTGIVYLF